VIALDVRNQSQVPSSLYRRAELTLVPGTRPGRAPRENLPPVRDQPAQRVSVLIIKPLDVALAELAYFSEAHRSVLPLRVNVVTVFGVVVSRVVTFVSIAVSIVSRVVTFVGIAVSIVSRVVTFVGIAVSIVSRVVTFAGIAVSIVSRVVTFAGIAVSIVSRVVTFAGLVGTVVPAATSIAVVPIIVPAALVHDRHGQLAF